MLLLANRTFLPNVDKISVSERNHIDPHRRLNLLVKLLAQIHPVHRGRLVRTASNLSPPPPSSIDESVSMSRSPAPDALSVYLNISGSVFTHASVQSSNADIAMAITLFLVALRKPAPNVDLLATKPPTPSAVNMLATDRFSEMAS